MGLQQGCGIGLCEVPVGWAEVACSPVPAASTAELTWNSRSVTVPCAPPEV